MLLLMLRLEVDLQLLLNQCSLRSLEVCFPQVDVLEVLGYLVTGFGCCLGSTHAP